jgi:hypothetical protein
MKQKLKVSQSELSLEIDLKEVFGRSVNTQALQISMGEFLIDRILKRTSEGKGVENGEVVKLKSPYSDEYANSLEFKGFDKQKNKVNMKLTGSMLSSIEVLSTGDSKIKIGIDNEDTPKAYNHQTGDTVPKRPFFGLVDEDLKALKKEFSPVFGEKVTAQDLFDADRFQRIIRLFSGGSRRFEFEE